MHRFKNYLLFSFIIGIFTGLYQYLFGETLFGMPTLTNRLYLLFSDNLVLGHFLSRLFLLLIGFMIVYFNH